MLPNAKAIVRISRGATRDSRGIYLPNYIEPVSHIAVDVGGSLAKVVYFTRSPDPPSSPSIIATQGSASPSSLSTPSPRSRSPSNDSADPNGLFPKRNGALTPLILNDPQVQADVALTGLSNGSLMRDTILRRTIHHFPGGSLNFERFETDAIDECVAFIQDLIARSAEVNGVSIDDMRRSVKIMATGGGAHKFYELFRDTLAVEVRREDEMECLIEGLKFITLIPDEVYYFSDELIQSVSAGKTEGPSDLERPSPNPPKYAVTFESNPTPQLPCLLVNIGSGVSVIKVDEDGTYERVSGTSLGGGTLWGLLSLLTPATSFDEMLKFSEGGDNSSVDMLVGDIYGQDYGRLGLKSTTIASSFGHAATIATLSYAIRFWSKGTKRALFLRHEGFLGSIGAWMKNIDELAN
ncbi:Pantothenate kinase [Mycena kentingensis (nom. inval.)]|nr:Pantothenate kinase [Mycena kentingensis (nom. inval.)]